LLSLISNDVILQVPDGVNSLIIGKVSKVDCPIAIAGGNCTLIGFDMIGDDKFWTVCFLFSIKMLKQNHSFRRKCILCRTLLVSYIIALKTGWVIL